MPWQINRGLPPAFIFKNQRVGTEGLVEYILSLIILKSDNTRPDPSAFPGP